MNSKNNVERFFQLINEDSKPVVEKQKLYSIANKLIGIVPEFKNPTETFLYLSRLGNMQREYLFMFGLKNVCKIAIILYFTKKGKGQSKINEILDSIYFATLFTTEGNDFEEPCDYCSGDGNYTCSNCDGNGNIECEECNGDGELECSECEGTGMIGEEECDNCDGKGAVECTQCDGSGSETCGYCGGDGSNECEDCDGQGYNYSDEKVFDLLGFCFWDKNLKNLLEIREQQNEPALKEISEKIHKNSIQIVSEENHMELPDEIEDDEYYCVSVSENPEYIGITKNMNIKIEVPDRDLSFITKDI